MKTRFQRLSNSRVLVLAVLLLLGGVAHADLWDDAVDWFERNADLIPGRLEISFQQYNGRGRLLSNERTILDVRIDSRGEIVSQVLYAERDGNDITAERREDPAGTPEFFGGGSDQEGDSPFSGLQKSPFDPAEQPSVIARDTGRRESRGGRLTHIYEFTHAINSEANAVGRAWIAAGDGAPVAIETSLEPLPGFVDTFAMTQTYETSGDRWYVDSMRFDGEGRILFLKRRIESEMSFREYFRR